MGSHIGTCIERLGASEKAMERAQIQLPATR